MIETVASTLRLPIIGRHGGRISASQSRGAWYQAPLDRVAEGLPTARQSIFPGRRRMVDGVSSQHTCGLWVHQSVQAIGGRGVPRQVWGSSCVSGSRDTTSDDSSARVLGKATRLQMGRIGHDRQHPKRQQSDFVWLQTLCSRGAVLVCPSIVLEEEVVVADQRPGAAPRDAKDLLAALVSTESQRSNLQESETQGRRSETMERIQGCTEVQSLRDSAPCNNRLSPRHQGRQEVSQQTCHTEQQFKGRDT